MAFDAYVKIAYNDRVIYTQRRMPVDRLDVQDIIL